LGVRSAVIEEKARSIIVDLFGNEAQGIENPSRENIGSWDSLRHVELIFAIEDAFGISFEEPEMERLVSLQSIVEALERKS
jgi:acyl carrier protein